MTTRAKGRVLVVAWAFAPAAPIGTFRPLRLVRQLVAEDWEVSVVMAKPDSYGPDVPIEPALLERVPPSVRIVHARNLRLPSLKLGAGAAHAAPRPQGASTLARPASKQRSLLTRRLLNAVDEVTSIPDNKSGWIGPAITRALIEVGRRRPDVIYSTAPPWSGQVVALTLARLTRLPWVADFRDPWARAPWRESQPARIRRAAVRLERAVVARADAVLFATHTNRDEYASHYGVAASGRFHVVPNGCDADEFVGLRQRVPAAEFVVLHAGSLYGQRSPVPLFRALASAFAEGALDRQSFRLRLIGAVSAGSTFERDARALGLAGVVEFVERLPRNQILEEMARASCLLVLQPGTTVSIPGKLYEYFAAGRPILALAEQGELADLVRESGVGIVAAPHDEPAIVRALRELVATRNTDASQHYAPSHLYDGARAAAEAVRIIRGALSRGKVATHVAPLTRES